MPDAPSGDLRDGRLILGGVDAEQLARDFGTPLYVYEEAVIRRQARLLHESFGELRPELHFALKANFNPAILEVLKDEGCWIDAVSPFEVQFALALGFDAEQVLFTGNNMTDTELRYCIEQGVPVNVGSLGELERFGKLNPGATVSVRINPDVGAGHHPHVITGGPLSKFGIYFTERDKILALLSQYGLRLTGVHSHIGTGILRTEEMLAAMEIILHTAQLFEELEFINFGGGFGIPYQPDQQPLPLEALGREMARRFLAFCESYGRPLRMKLEPGRFLVAQAGSLLARVTNITETPAHRFVGTDSGFNHLMRPVLYGAHHEVVNASHGNGEERAVTVVGNICESGDVFTQGKDGIENRKLPAPEVGHLLAFRDAGAYGMALASQYNMRPRPAEVMVRDGRARLIRRRETYDDLVRNFPAFD